MARRNRKALFVVALLVGVFFHVQVIRAAETGPQTEVKVFSSKLGQKRSIQPFGTLFTGGASVAVGDTDGDDKDEIIVGAGPGGGPNVQVFEANGRRRASFMAYAGSYKNGINIAACDLTGDGKAEIITSPRLNGGPNVQVYNEKGKKKFGFMAYARDFRGGVTVACGNVMGDERIEIITGSGYDGGNHVRVFDRRGKFAGIDFWPYAKSETGGVSVGVANVDGGDLEEVVTSIQRFGKARIKIYRAESTRPILAEFTAFTDGFKGGATVAGADLSNDGRDEVIVGANGNGGPNVQAYSGQGKYQKGFFPYPMEFRGGVFVAGGDVIGDKRDEVITGPGPAKPATEDEIGRRVMVDLSEQRLYAYDEGRQVNTFLVSTGVARYPTPTGEFKVFRRIPIMDYQWTYGPEHPDNYDIKDVKWNLNFTNHYYLHTAYWHNNFGHRMSHGCVNISESNAKWLYDWASVGLRVRIQE